MFEQVTASKAGIGNDSKVPLIAVGPQVSALIAGVHFDLQRVA